MVLQGHVPPSTGDTAEPKTGLEGYGNNVEHVTTLFVYDRYYSLKLSNEKQFV